MSHDNPVTERRFAFRRIPLGRLQAALQAAGGPRPLRLEALPGGAVNSNYKVDLDGVVGPWLVRIHARPEVARVEWALLARLESEGLPTPRVRWCAAETELGAPISIQSWLPGVTLERALAGTRGGARRRLLVAAAEPMGRVHRLLRGQAVGALVCGDGGLRTQPWDFGDDFVARCLAHPRVQAELSAAERAGVAALDAAVRARPALPAGLVHGDWNPSNLLIGGTPEAPRVTGILDWEYAHCGSPAHDWGQLLRREPLEPAEVRALGASLERTEGALPADWWWRGRVMDLSAQLEFLCHLPERARTRRADAARRVRQTLAELREESGTLI